MGRTWSLSPFAGKLPSPPVPVSWYTPDAPLQGLAGILAQGTMTLIKGE